MLIRGQVLLPILKTKLAIPPGRPRDQLVQRQRLVEKLDHGLERGCRLTLISAPAGFGKSTLIREWAAKQPGAVAWLSLDREDGEATQFWTYLIAALETVIAGVGEATLAKLLSPQPPPRSELLVELLNALAASVSRPLALVLDDYHLIEEASIHQDLAFFLDHLPLQVHLVISTRYDPALPLSKLRGRGELNELRMADLRFTPDEAATFLNQVMGLDLSADQVRALENRTEGWIAGLQMAALSMQGRERQGVENFIAALTGSHRYILDYLVEEVLLQQPEELRNFLARTSILERLTGPLCDHVCGRTDGKETLEDLEAANLFIIPLDDERRWYRYHHLFADLLRKRLGEREPELTPTLHQRASEWYEREKLTVDALSHALAIGDLDRTSRLIGANALAMMEHGELRTLERWLSLIPEQEISSLPWLAVAHAWMLSFTGKTDESQRLLAELDLNLASDTHTDGQSEKAIQGHIAAIRTQIASVKGEMEDAVVSARTALALLPADDLSTRAWLSMALGLNLGRRGAINEGEKELSKAVTLGRRSGDGHVTVLSLCNLAAFQLAKGELQRAANSYRDALETAENYTRRTGHRLPVSGYAYTYLGMIHCEWNDLEAALSYGQEGIQLCEQWGEPELLAGAYTCLAEILQTAGDDDGALEAIGRAEQVAEKLSPFYLDRVEREAALIQLKAGDLVSASRWASAYEDWATSSKEALDDHPTGLALGQIKLAQGRPAEALELATLVLADARRTGADLRVLRALILQAVALLVLDQTERATSALEEALLLAEPEKHVRAFLDHGKLMIQLLKLASRRGIAPTYVARLLEAWSQKQGRPMAQASPPVGPLIEPLSERELEVLQLMAAGLSNREIAQELYISVNTIKTHAKSIYSKLVVNRRTQAVSRARELDLL